MVLWLLQSQIMDAKMTLSQPPDYRIWTFASECHLNHRKAFQWLRWLTLGHRRRDFKLHFAQPSLSLATTTSSPSTGKHPALGWHQVSLIYNCLYMLLLTYYPLLFSVGYPANARPTTAAIHDHHKTWPPQVSYPLYPMPLNHRQRNSPPSGPQLCDVARVMSHPVQHQVMQIWWGSSQGKVRRDWFYDALLYS